MKVWFNQRTSQGLSTSKAQSSFDGSCLSQPLWNVTGLCGLSVTPLTAVQPSLLDPVCGSLCRLNQEPLHQGKLLSSVFVLSLSH